jgi:hypothetical protein
MVRVGKCSEPVDGHRLDDKNDINPGLACSKAEDDQRSKCALKTLVSSVGSIELSPRQTLCCGKGNAMPTTAIVIGGSLAGMCAARVLSEFVDAVTVIERDAYPSAHDFRPGVPQARHVHNLLAGGLREFEGFSQVSNVG